MTSGIIVALIICATILLVTVIISGAVFLNANWRIVEKWLDRKPVDQ